MRNSKHHGHKVGRIRELKGMKQEALAELLGISQQAVSKLEQSENIDDAVMDRIAKAFGVSASAIRNFNEDALFNNIQMNSDTGVLQVTAHGGNGDYNFVWNDVPGAALAPGLCRGVYTLEVADQLGCNNSETYIINEPERLDLRVIKRELPRCNSGCDGSMEVIASGGTESYTYAWAAGSSGPVQNLICAGSHSVTATDANGCVITETYDLGEPASLKLTLVENKPPVCHDGCDGALAVTTHGGAGGYSYHWNDGETDARNAALCPGTYSIQVVDANNCITSERYTVLNVPPVEIDLGGGRVVCEGQSHELDAGPQWKKVEWFVSGSVLWSGQKIQIAQPGVYTVKAIDINNCEATDQFVLETSNDLLQATMILAAEAQVGDTVVIIDVSWPLPDQIAWHFPEEMIKIRDNDDVVFGKFEDAGQYDITLSATLGLCHDEVTKTITILGETGDVEGGRLGAEDFVKAFTLHPNPNTGSFELEVEFADASPITITIWSFVNSTLISKTQETGSAGYRKHFDLNPITSGMYLLRIDFKGGHRTVRFLVH